jgi:hypothetical protein
MSPPFDLPDVVVVFGGAAIIILVAASKAVREIHAWS